MRCEIPCLDTPDTHEHPSAADKAQTLEQKKKKNNVRDTQELPMHEIRNAVGPLPSHK